MKKLYFIVGILVLLLIGCAKEPIDPGIAILISPSNDETCFDGISLNDTQSNVSFSWSTAENAISYELIVSDLLTQSSQTYTTNTNQTTIALTKAKPYSWQVKSIGELGSNVIDSESWKFYLAGDAVINYAPFPAELITPRSGANVTPDINSLLTLNWICSDVDGDLESFEVYLDQADGSTLITTLDYQASETTIELKVENNATYYWKVIAIDANGNQSSSGVYAFRTN